MRLPYGVFLNENEHNFGVVPDSVQHLFHTFVLFNNSTDTCIIKHVERSCGCTKVYYDKDIIPPGEKADINVTLDLGSNYSFFERYINIYTSFSKEPLTAFVKASREMPPPVLKQQFPFKVSESIRLSLNCVIMGYVQQGEAISKSINIINLSDKQIQLENNNNEKNGYLKVYCPSVLEPNEIAHLFFLYSVPDCSDTWGEQRISFFVGERGGMPYEVVLDAIVTDKFEQNRGKGPRIKMLSTIVDLQDFENYGTLRRKNIVIENIGDDVLILRDLQVFGPLTCNTIQDTIPPNGQTQLSIMVPIDNNEDDNWDKNYTIGISSNDKHEPYKVITVLNHFPK